MIRDELIELEPFYAQEWKEASTGPGWDELILSTHRAILALGPYRIFQIKEKFGGLRYYIEGTTEQQELAREAENRSALICEECGAPGHLGQKGKMGWVKTLCDEHAPDEWTRWGESS